jgi:hypothetical protein
LTFNSLSNEFDFYELGADLLVVEQCVL